jgi:hypothetical protein
MKSVTADLIFRGGEIIAMDDPVRAVSLDMAVANGRIVALGSESDVSGLFGDNTEIIDVKGMTVMPGLIDSHNHMVRFGENLKSIEVTPTRVKRITDILDKLENKAKNTPPGEWIQAWGYDDTQLEDRRHPVNEDLDKVCPQHPVILMRTCMHVMAVNSYALKMARISRKTPDPPGGRIGRKEDGAPNGLLFELGAMNLVNRLLPLPNASACAESLNLASEVYVREGLTTVTEAGAGWSGNPHEAAGFQIAWSSDQLTPRVNLGLMEETYNLFIENRGTGLFTGFGDDFLKLGPAKFVADGGIGAKTAALSEPYENSSDCGVMCEDSEDLRKRMEAAHRAGYQIAVHAIGDRTIDMVLSNYEKILTKYPRAHRHRIEHLAVCKPEFFKRIRQLQIIAVVQPAFLHYLGDSFIKNLGPQRLEYTIPIRSMIENGILVAGSSDRPVTEGNPWSGIWAAVNRKTVSNQSIGLEQQISVEQALKLYTTNSAYTNFLDHRLGMLSPGKYADIIVLDKNPLAIAPKELKGITVLRTFIEGKEVYRKE